jgi:imidazolonepropionase-like amidohydrolase
VYPGFSLHDELALLVEAGLTPLQALQTATINPARFLGQEALFGTIAAGKTADLVLLDGNPLADVGATSRINGVVANGQFLSRDQLSALLAEAEAAAKRLSP